jgi:nitrogen fixation/metabolism regulation signal transduction histidine kinase
MLSEQLNKAWQPFFTTKTYGIGLGLTLAEKIIKAHGGQLDLIAAQGAGICATISLPFNAASAELMDKGRIIHPPKSSLLFP